MENIKIGDTQVINQEFSDGVSGVKKPAASFTIEPIKVLAVDALAVMRC